MVVNKLSEDLFVDKFSGCCLDDESIKALCPEFKEIPYKDYSQSPTYQEWQKAKEERGISQTNWAKENGIKNFYKVVNGEIYEKQVEREKKVYNAFCVFVEAHKKEIFEKQVKAWNKEFDEKEKLKNRRLEIIEEAKLKALEKWREECLQFTDGRELAIEDKYCRFINKLLSVGYKVKCASKDVVYLYWDKSEKMTDEQAEQLKPFQFDEKTVDFREITNHGFFITPTVETERINGVLVKKNWFLKGFEYPVEIKEYEKELIF